MKALIYTIVTFTVLVAASPSLAVTCRVLEGDGAEASGKTRVEAEKNAWKACISKKVAIREASRGPVDADQALEDAEPCLNAKMKCQ